MASVWTHGVWTVKPGREVDFARGWQDMAEIALTEVTVVRPPTLLRDRDRPNVFVSFGPWPNLDEIERFRASATFQSRVAAMDELIETFETRTLDEVYPGD